ncbi:putative DNA modification/repair radical SAM protein [Apibacter sp. B3889]|uniref:putative DNA modification/repair radical SAM protein n=1 Tax=unclassified Apibacter TaxID=2630820 RepID=UPI001328EE3F|nr:MULTISPECIES: putative DNA modification/repair radical SAM protein [unclassified Apibacter]MXO31930.1 putative DNA modification/repair radical SAM protein [Apibacter sp. B2912]MXO34366.1 putative DNA modification/repair radical SAM protein [Apibacter sp. B3883]MXO41503.1 putative DNA modification/repair radical SAM protein [Apibacter sp. B3889]MXP03073.1 putative DNA modification/repair radical SAM protein [Apibacter sp. B3887]MXP07664.1 putative DNA modification/repair radical SAM protein 
MNEQIINKLATLAESAKYDVSCSSSGVGRKSKVGGIGSTSSSGICHTFTEDGRCVSLLKIMMTNYCMYDCAYCISRKSNDIKRASFSVKELVELTLEFYKRNYIEGLFLSSGVVKSPDHTMERMVRVIKELRTVHKYNGYIHMKSIPGASKELVTQAGLYADRLSVNIEIPTEKNLKFLAPEKDHKSVFAPMKYIQNGVLEYKEEKKKYKSIPKFTPAGQSTQMIIGATNETDQDILKVSSLLYMQSSMRRVYYSGFIPVNPHDNRLPALQQAPLVRENRLYQADWLMRFYHFTADEIIDDTNPNLDLEVDPKLSWALRHPEMFPVDVNTAEYRQIVRVPGIGIKSAKLIIASRKFGKLDRYQLKKIGVIIKRAQYFITCRDSSGTTINEIKPEFLKKILVNKKHTSQNTNQISLIFP